MDKRKPSRTNVVKYSYKLTKSQSVIEYTNDISYFIWDIKLLKNNKPHFITEHKSFHRTKKWLIEHYAEFFI